MAMREALHGDASSLELATSFRYPKDPAFAPALALESLGQAVRGQLPSLHAALDSLQRHVLARDPHTPQVATRSPSSSSAKATSSALSTPRLDPSFSWEQALASPGGQPWPSAPAEKCPKPQEQVVLLASAMQLQIPALGVLLPNPGAEAVARQRPELSEACRLVPAAKGLKGQRRGRGTRASLSTTRDLCGTSPARALATAGTSLATSESKTVASRSLRVGSGNGSSMEIVQSTGSMSRREDQGSGAALATAGAAALVAGSTVLSASDRSSSASSTASRAGATRSPSTSGRAGPALTRTASTGAGSVNMQQHLVAGGLAGVASRTATAPLETVRLRMMSAQGSYTVGSTARELWQEAGWRAFFRGNLLNVLRAAPQKAIDFCAFETFKGVLNRAFPNSPAELRLAASGAMAGGLSTLVLYPLDSVRGRMLAQRSTSALRYAGVADAFLTIARREGLASLYRGLAPSLLSILPEAAITYGFNDVLKMAYQRATGVERVEPLPALMCGVTSAFTGQLVAYPLEVVARHAQVSAVRRGIVKTAQHIVRTQGLGGLYKGIAPASAKLIPMAMISFGVYESAKVLLSHLEARQEAEKAQMTMQEHNNQ